MLERGQQRASLVLTSGAPVGGSAPANALLDLVEFGDALNASLAIGAGPGGGEFVELPSDVRPAERKLDIVASRERAVSG